MNYLVSTFPIFRLTMYLVCIPQLVRLDQRRATVERLHSDLDRRNIPWFSVIAAEPLHTFSSSS